MTPTPWAHAYDQTRRLTVYRTPTGDVVALCMLLQERRPLTLVEVGRGLRCSYESARLAVRRGVEAGVVAVDPKRGRRGARVALTIAALHGLSKDTP